LHFTKNKTNKIKMKYDIIVLGSGPGGYVTAIRASQLGFKVANRERKLGMLKLGMYPTKALLKSAQVLII
jgi:dihydrolipoamide dehydrogenase